MFGYFIDICRYDIVVTDLVGSITKENTFFGISKEYTIHR